MVSLKISKITVTVVHCCLLIKSVIYKSIRNNYLDCDDEHLKYRSMFTLLRLGVTLEIVCGITKAHFRYNSVKIVFDIFLKNAIFRKKQVSYCHKIC